MTQTTDAPIKDLIAKINRLIPEKSSLEHWQEVEGSEKEYFGELCMPAEIATLQALVQRLEQAEKVIEHYADEANWVGVNVNGKEATNHDLFVPSDNGYDKARAYLSEGEKK